MLPAGNLIGHSEWTDRKADVGSFAATIRANSGTPQQGDDMPAYRQWDPADKQALVDDIAREVLFGKHIDGTPVDHLVDASVSKAVELINLVRVGDDPDPATGDTHPGLDTVLDRVNAVDADLAALSDAVATQGETLATILAAVSPPPAPEA